jgi:anti-sigma B factor antagonist
VSAEYSERDGVLIVAPQKRLDTATTPAVEQEVMARIDAGTSKVVFDFGNTEYISSAGLRVMVKAAKAVAKSGGGVAVTRTNTHVKEVLKLSGFEILLKSASSVDKAIAAL